MTTDALRRLQALHGQPRPASAFGALAQVQVDLQTVIEAVLELAGHDGEHACRRENAPARPAAAPESDAQPEDMSVDPETENGPENGAQGRIGWLRVEPGDEYRHAARERAAAARALRELADDLGSVTHGRTSEALSHWPDHDRGIYELAIEEASGKIHERADELEAGEDRG